MADISNPLTIDRTHKAADCPTCGGKPEKTEVVNHSLMWHDGDVICAKADCCRYVREWDAG